MATVRLSKLPPYVDLAIKSADYLPINTLNAVTGIWRTHSATGIQVAEYVVSTVTDQSLFQTSDVKFNSVTGLASVSTTNLSSSFIYGDGSHITNVFNQTLNTTNSVKFAELTSNNINTGTISATQISINGLNSPVKYSAIINHAGSPATTIHTISHPLTSEEVIFQVFERTVIPGGAGNVQLEMVLTNVFHTTNSIISFATIPILNVNNATYKVVILG